MKLKVLDCTFRDGGYYVNWDFDKNLVLKYLKSIELSKIDIIELGFRFMSKNVFQGAYAHTSDDFVDTLPLPNNILLSVIVNASDLIYYKGGLDDAVIKLFQHKSKSRVDIVRIAVHVPDIPLTYELAKKLKKLGYFLCLNIMQVDSLSSEKLTYLSKQIQSWNNIDVLYFADSFGNMDSLKIKETVKAIKKGWNGDIGFHAHDNKGLALINSLSALDEGVKYIDSTILGMGRGAGNTKTENLLLELKNKSINNYNPQPLFSLSMNDFQLLKNKHQWGPNLYYYLSAIYGIHPTYIQVMLSDKRYDVDSILSKINSLKNVNSSSFDIDKLDLLENDNSLEFEGKWSPANMCFGREILIIGSGPSSDKYLDDLIQFIKKKNLLVFCVNLNSKIPTKIIDIYIACNQTRFLLELENFQDLEKPLIIPKARVPDSAMQKISNLTIYDYGMKIEKGKMKILDKGCTLDKQLTLIYAISIATAGKAKKIYLTGVDGYNLNSPEQNEMIEMLNLYNNLENKVNITAITPTNYPISKSSIFDPNL